MRRCWSVSRARPQPRDLPASPDPPRPSAAPGTPTPVAPHSTRRGSRATNPQASRPILPTPGPLGPWRRQISHQFVHVLAGWRFTTIGVPASLGRGAPTGTDYRNCSQPSYSSHSCKQRPEILGVASSASTSRPGVSGTDMPGGRIAGRAAKGKLAACFPEATWISALDGDVVGRARVAAAALPLAVTVSGRPSTGHRAWALDSLPRVKPLRVHS